LKTITSDNIAIRFAFMWILGFVILLFAWVFSFRILPQGVVRGSSGAYFVPVKAENTTETFARIFLWNLCLGCFPVAIGNLIRVKHVPLGYLLAFYHWGIYGVLLGTNSFVIPGPGRFIPSLITLFYGSGMYEILSYTLISSATFSLHDRYEDSISDTSCAKKHSWNTLTLSKTELAVILVAIIILAISNYYEAWHIFHA
jgi:hypothetical protein